MKLADHQIRIMRAWSQENDDTRRVQAAVEEAQRWLRDAPIKEQQHGA